MTFHSGLCAKFQGAYHEKRTRKLPGAIRSVFHDLLSKANISPTKLIELIREFPIHDEQVNECRHEHIEDFDKLNEGITYKTIQSIEFIRSIVVCMKATFLGDSIYASHVTSANKQGIDNLSSNKIVGSF